ncbi:MAG: type II toxin-antitoxin system VapC family toxin [Deltaproteobacteria bacterium]|nr:type II toxin-antitoxin system VapC family toxin [Deltaproteobacteria bacterium]
MLIPDVNVLIYAHRAESPEHDRYADWLRRLALGPEPFALSDLGASGFVRIVTNPKIWDVPTNTLDAIAFIDRLRSRFHARPLHHGPASWKIFSDLCVEAKARGKLVADAYHAALAIEHGCELVTCDGDFARFAGLRHRHPLAS